MRARFRLRVLLVCAALAGTTGESTLAQSPPVGTLVAERRLEAGQADTTSLDLERQVFYILEVEGGAGEPAIIPAGRPRQRALVVPHGHSTGALFEVRTGWTGSHTVRFARLTAKSAVVLRLYADDARIRRAERRHDDDFAVGLALGAGMHSGYRLDPSGGEPPGGGGDAEVCVLAESRSIVSACLGIARQRFPDGGLTVTWYFIEPRLRLWHGAVLGNARTDVGVSLRIAQGGETRPRNISPSQLAPGLYVVHHLAAHGRRRGWSLYLSYSHGRLGNVPETEFRDTDRLAGGLAWVP